MKNILKHLDNIEISAIADKESTKAATFYFKLHKLICRKCKKQFNDYNLLSSKIIESFRPAKSTNSKFEKFVYIYNVTSKAALYLLLLGFSLSSVGIAYAQTQTDEDIIPDIKLFEDGEIISFSEEELENLFSEVVDPIQATFITFLTTETITSEEVSQEVEKQVEVLTTLIEQTEVIEQSQSAAEAIISEAVIDAATEVVEDVIENASEAVDQAERDVEDEVLELKNLKMALIEIDENIDTAKEQNNSKALGGLENARSNILKSIEKAEKELDEAKDKAGKEIEKAKEKAGKEIEKAKEKAGEILSEIAPEDSEKEVVKAQLKAERTLEKAKEKAEKELDEAKEKAEKELEKAKEKAEKEAEKAEKELDEAKEKAEKELEKAKEKAEK